MVPGPRLLAQWRDVQPLSSRQVRENLNHDLPNYIPDEPSIRIMAFLSFLPAGIVSPKKTLCAQNRRVNQHRPHDPCPSHHAKSNGRPTQTETHRSASSAGAQWRRGFPELSLYV